LKKQRSADQDLSDLFSRIAQACVVFVLLLAPWTFGSVYYSGQCVLAIGLLAAMGIWWFQTAIDSDKSQHIPYISLLVVAGLAIALLQLTPLPKFALLLAGRQLELYQQFSGDPPVTPRLSLFPEGTWHLAQLLVIALAAVLLAGRFFRTPKEMITLLILVACNGLALSLLGIFQKLSDDNRIFWMYEFAHGPFSTFVNRNNAAGYLLMTLSCCVGLLPIVLPVRVTTGPLPLISREMPYWRQLSQYFFFCLAELNATKITLLLGTAIISSAIIASVSRGGSAALLAGLVFTFFTYGLARRPQNLSIIMLPLISMILALSAWVGFSDQLLNRWQKTDLVQLSQMDTRIQHWKDTWPVTREMGLFGAGLGSYPHIHRLYSETSENTIFEYAENNYFQALVEAGWPGLILFLAAWLLAFRYALLLIIRGQSDSTIGIGTMGIFLLSSQATASLFDFGLYIPANMTLMAALVGLLGYHAQSFSAKLKKPNLLRFRMPNRPAAIGILILFGVLSASARNLYRHSRIEAAIKNDLKIAKQPNGDWDYEQMGMSQTTRRINEFKSLLLGFSSINGLNHLGELWIHRSRLMSLEILEKTPEFRDTYALAADDDERESLKNGAWNLTRLERTRNHIQDMGANYSQLRAVGVTKEPFISENIPFAVGSYAQSCASAPLQPVVHMKLGQLRGILSYSPNQSPGAKEIANAIKLAPTNPQYRLIAGIFFAQGRDIESAAPQFKRFLQLRSYEMKMAMDILYASTEFNSYAITPKTVLETILPEDPLITYQFAKTWCQADPATKQRALEKTLALLPDSEMGEQEKLKIRANVHLERNETGLAIDTMAAILRGNPLEEDIRFQRGHLLLQEKRFTEALDEAKNLVRSNRMHRGYNLLLKQVEFEIRKLEDTQPNGGR
jgi:hypothetical protein